MSILDAHLFGAARECNTLPQIGEYRGLVPHIDGRLAHCTNRKQFNKLKPKELIVLGCRGPALPRAASRPASAAQADNLFNSASRGIKLHMA